MSRKGIFQLSKKTVRKRLAPVAIPTVVPEPITQPHYEKILQHIQENTERQYVQGQDRCPICQGIVNYTWSHFQGFIVYECSKNDCLPWPMGGARGRRENGEPKLMAKKRIG